MNSAITGPTASMARPRALITGASSGIGEVFAERLAREGYDLVVVARRADRLERLARRLMAEIGVQVEAVAADLTDAAARQTLERRIARDDCLTMLVNNAGFGAYMPFVELEPDRAEEQVQLHITALVRLTRAALPGMIARGQGAIINVSSLLSFSAGLNLPNLPQRVMYAATKAFINSFSELLAGELADSGIRVQALCPGRVQTEFSAVAGQPTPAGVAEMMPADVVQASLVALREGEVICVPGLPDPQAIDDARRLQHGVVGFGRTATLAPRYTA